jgi:hypothetical protein
VKTNNIFADETKKMINFFLILHFLLKKSGLTDIFDWLIDWCSAGGLGLLGEAGATFDNSFFDNSFGFLQQCKDRSFLGTFTVHKKV